MNAKEHRYEKTSMLTAMVALLMLTPLSTALVHADDYKLLKKWGSACRLRTDSGCIDPDGSGPLQKGDGQFNRPGDIALDPLSNVVYVVDNLNGRIQKFDSNGKFITKWGSNGTDNGQFRVPGEISIDPSNRVVYVVDTENDRIQKFDSNGKFITKWGSHCKLRTDSGCIDPDGSGPLQKGDGQFDHPGDVALDSSGELLYVTDSRNNRVQKFDSDGNFITKWGSQGITDGKFDFPTGLAVDYLGRNIYVADSKNDRIQKFDSNGKFITKWGSHCDFSTGSGCIDPDGSGPLRKGDGQFNAPRGVFVDSTGKLVYAVDITNDRIQKFDSNGKFITKWGSSGTNRGEFNTIGGIAGIGLASASSGGLFVDSSSVVVYVADKENDNVQVFTRTLTTNSQHNGFVNTLVIAFVILVGALIIFKIIKSIRTQKIELID